MDQLPTIAGMPVERSAMTSIVEAYRSNRTIFPGWSKFPRKADDLSASLSENLATVRSAIYSEVFG